MNADPGDRGSRHRLIIGAVVALVLVGAILGGFLGLLGSALVSVLPEADRAPARSVREPTTYEPLTPQSPTPTQEPSGTATTESPRPPKDRPTLAATPLEVGTYERIDLTGTFPDLPEGVTLQVERKEGGTWAVFPVTATTRAGGTFSTYVQTGRVGENKFRVTDPGSGRSTPPVTVLVG